MKTRIRKPATHRYQSSLKKKKISIYLLYLIFLLSQNIYNLKYIRKNNFRHFILTSSCA